MIITKFLGIKQYDVRVTQHRQYLCLINSSKSMHICLPSLMRLHNVSYPVVLLKSLPCKQIKGEGFCLVVKPQVQDLLFILEPGGVLYRCHLAYLWIY